MNPKTRSKFTWISLIKNIKFRFLILFLVIVYLSINLFFAIIYWKFNIFEDCSNFFNYFYFSCITSFTVGYGDFSPKTDFGKIIVIIHTCISTISYAFIVSILTLRLFYPKHTLRFSKKMFVNREKMVIGVRTLNIHREVLINPEIRIVYIEHEIGNVIATHKSLKVDNKQPLLGIHDFTFRTPIDQDFLRNLDAAIESDKNNKIKSRFRIYVSIIGNYELQQLAQYKIYLASDLIEGTSFKYIEYNKEDKKKLRSINYNKFKNFENDFDKII